MRGSPWRRGNGRGSCSRCTKIRRWDHKRRKTAGFSPARPAAAARGHSRAPASAARGPSAGRAWASTKRRVQHSPAAPAEGARPRRRPWSGRTAAAAPGRYPGHIAHIVLEPVDMHDAALPVTAQHRQPDRAARLSEITAQLTVFFWKLREPVQEDHMGTRPVGVHGLPRQLRAVKAAIGPRRAVRLYLPLRLPEPCAQRRLRRECKRKLPHSCALFLSSSHHRISYYSTARRNFLERGLKIAKNGHTLQKRRAKNCSRCFS